MYDTEQVKLGTLLGSAKWPTKDAKCEECDSGSNDTAEAVISGS
jgi:hypothetical protein